MNKDLERYAKNKYRNVRPRLFKSILQGLEYAHVKGFESGYTRCANATEPDNPADLKPYPAYAGKDDFVDDIDTMEDR